KRCSPDAANLRNPFCPECDNLASLSHGNLRFPEQNGPLGSARPERSCNGGGFPGDEDPVHQIYKYQFRQDEERPERGPRFPQAPYVHSTLTEKIHRDRIGASQKKCAQWKKP